MGSSGSSSLTRLSLVLFSFSSLWQRRKISCESQAVGGLLAEADSAVSAAGLVA